MTSNSGPNPKILAGIVGALALGLVAIPIVAPSAPTPASSQASLEVEEVIPDGASVVNEPSGESVSSDNTSAAPLPAEGNESVTGDAAAEATLFSALAAYESQLVSAGGVYGSFISANSQEMMISLAPNGDFRAVTTDPNAPEWLYVDPVLYARLGTAELAAQKKALEAIGKPDAVWTDAAMNGEQQGVYLSAANISNAVADLVPLMKRIQTAEGPESTTVIQGVIDLTGDLGLNAEAYNLKPADSSEGPAALRQASVVFTIDASGVLQGFIVQPPGSAQPVSLLLTRFDPTRIKRPSPPRIITLEDLAPIVDDSTTVAPSPTPTPAP